MVPTRRRWRVRRGVNTGRLLGCFEELRHSRAARSRTGPLDQELEEEESNGVERPRMTRGSRIVEGGSSLELPRLDDHREN